MSTFTRFKHALEELCADFQVTLGVSENTHKLVVHDRATGAIPFNEDFLLDATRGEGEIN